MSTPFNLPFCRHRHLPRCGRARLQRLTLALANEAPASLYDAEHGIETTQLTNDAPEASALANAVTIDEQGWAFIPYGDWPHEQGLQKFHRPQAEAIANSFNSMSGRFKRAVCGLPIFKGHPDLPGPPGDAYPDKDDKGQIAAMEVRPDGLALKLVLGNAGVELVRKGWKYISPYWEVARLGLSNGGFQVFEPTSLRSVGLVVKPNIPTPSLANSSAHAANPTNKMNPETLKLLGLAADAKPEQIDAKIKKNGTIKILTKVPQQAIGKATTHEDYLPEH